jgi:hypothetical protein
LTQAYRQFGSPNLIAHDPFPEDMKKARAIALAAKRKFENARRPMAPTLP